MKKLLPILLCVLSLASCKQDKWIDWKLQNELYMTAVREQADLQSLPNGIMYKVRSKGNLTDAKPSIASTVTVTYETQLINGMMIDSGSNVSFQMSSIIEGLAEGIKQMHVHADYDFYVPWELAYGKDGNGDEGTTKKFIPPYSALYFRVHLSSVTN